MSEENLNFSLEIEGTSNRCPTGEVIAKQNQAGGKIPVLSCEGACIRGEIARQAANIVAKDERYNRACHGELLTVPESAFANWVENSEKVVLIDGCFMRCQGRILENLLGKDKLVQFDALSHYKKYTDLFEIEDVPMAERIEVANDVADWVISSIA